MIGKVTYKIGLLVFSAAMAGALGGCATKYQPEGLSGGFSEIQLNADTYEITAKGNGYTSQDRAGKIAMLRAAELTLQRERQRFVVLGGGTSSTYGGSTPVVVNRVGGSLIASGGDPIIRGNGKLVIQVLDKSDPRFPGAYDAKMIEAQLRPLLR